MARKFTKIPADTFKQLQMNAGLILDSFDPTGEADVQDAAILGATSGGLNFTAVPTFSDRGENIDNCPKNMAELKELDAWEVKASGTFVSMTAKLAQKMTAAAELATNKISPRNTIKITDFGDIWLVSDYGEDGMIAIHILNALSTGGFAIQTGDKLKGQFPFEFTGHYKMDAQDTPPFEIYVDAGTAAMVAASQPMAAKAVTK